MRLLPKNLTPNWPAWITTLIMFAALFGITISDDMMNPHLLAWIHKLSMAILTYNHQIAANSSPTSSPVTSFPLPGEPEK